MSIEKQVFFSVMVLIVHFLFIHLFIVAVQTLAEGPLCTLHCSWSWGSVMSTPQASCLREPHGLDLSQRVMQIINVKASEISIPQENSGEVRVMVGS